MKNILLCLIASLLGASLVYAESDPVAEAQTLLKNKAQREELIKKDDQARQADHFATQAVNGNAQAKEEIYGLSADIMAQLAQEGGNDPAKMQEILKKALQNPEAFKKSLSPEVQARIGAVVERIEKQPVSGSKSKSPSTP